MDIKLGDGRNVEESVLRSRACFNKGGTKNLLSEGDVVTIDEPESPTEVGLLGEDIPLTIVWRDEHLAVIDKPTGLVVHPAPGHASGTLVNALIHWAREEDVSLDIDDEVRPGLAHRIDKDTSGLIVVAFSDVALRGLQAQFAEHSIERIYRAVVLGKNLPESGRIETFYGPTRKTGKNTPAASRVPTAKPSPITSVAKRGMALSLVECRLETGRTHQMYLVEQKNRYSTSFTFADVCAEPLEERFNVLPGDVCAGRVREDRFESPLIGTLHSRTVPKNGTVRNIKPAFHQRIQGSRGYRGLTPVS